MAEWIEIEPGVWVDEEGEVVEGWTFDNSDLEWAAARYMNARQQREDWEKAEKFLKARLLNLTKGETNVVAGDYMISRRQAHRQVQNVDGFAQWAVGAELTEAEKFGLIEASKGWDPERVPSSLAEALSNYTTVVANAPFVVVGPVKKAAPKRKSVVD